MENLHRPQQRKNKKDHFGIFVNIYFYSKYLSKFLCYVDDPNLFTVESYFHHNNFEAKNNFWVNWPEKYRSNIRC